jgi:hypothetical protein
VTTYSLRYREVGSDEAGWSQPVVVDGTSHALTGLAPGVRYDVEVTAVSGASQSLATVGQRSTRCAAPSEPSALPAGYALSTDDPGTNGRLAVSWTEVTGAVSYEVRARTGAAAFTAVGDPVAGLATTLTGLDGAQSFDVEVMAVNVDGDRSVASTARTGVPAGIASGGDVTAFTADGSNGTAGTTYVVHRFATVGSESFTLHRDRTVEYLIVAGGGGGSRSGGGGAGGLRSGSTALTAGAARTIAVGGGGAGSSSSDAANDGGNSSALGLTASGGGGGGANAFAGAGRAGGSGGGGGAAAGGHVNAGGAGTTGQGRNGGSSYGFLSFPGGGGGGAGGAGGTAANDGTGRVTAGAGGLGLDSSITGTPTGYAGGGAGSPYQFNSIDSPGAARPESGGGSGGTVASNSASNTGGGAGADGRGGGGGGAPSNRTGGSGGSGAVIIRYALPA